MMKLVCSEPRAWGWRWRGVALLRDNKGPSAQEQEETERQSRRLRVSCPGTWTLACRQWEPLNIEELQVPVKPTFVRASRCFSTGSANRGHVQTLGIGHSQSINQSIR